MATQNWSRLVRFIAVEDSNVYYGDLGEKDLHFPYSGMPARVINGDPLGSDYVISDERLTVKELLSPIDPKEIPIVRMVGLNYAKHLVESGKPFPSSPTLFISASTAINGPQSIVTIPKIAQDGTLDYEGELVIIIGEKCKNVTPEQASKHILGYAVGNDVSSRKWQRENGSQWCFSKGFDGFAPFGPWITSSPLVKLEELELDVQVNEEQKSRQKSPISDMIFKPADIVSFFSQGTTLETGTVIFTGTPEGVGFGMNPAGFLGDGDVVTVTISPTLGKISNRMKFEN